MVRFASVTALTSLVVPPLFFFFLRADELTGPLKENTITTAPGKVGDLLRQWWQEGTAAGNLGDVYDNRDKGHSDLDMGPYPQLRKVVYSPEEIQKGRHWSAQVVLRKGVVFGNSSTSAPPTAGGSNPRMYYVQPAGIAFLYRQYTANNLYIYPEHRDHDPGHNGPDEGFGDLYPTNTPYLIISQGSSGSDQPFMRALPFTLAAFRPEVKKKLVETGLLMPTVQMLLRSTNRQLAKPEDYLTGLAHPTVFEGSWFNELALVQAAHALTVDNLPPMVQMKVLEEDHPVQGRDFFELTNLEILADTPAVIARIIRGKDYRRRLVVSAERSFDVNQKPLSFTWTVLRGDKDKIAITPKNKEKSVVEIVVPYHDRRPIAPGSPLESNRVDIGVFVNNGTYNSAPGFVTFYSMDNEARTYDDKGRVLEIGYGMGETRLTVTDWPAFVDVLVKEEAGPSYFSLSKETRGRFADAVPKLKMLQSEWKRARGALDLYQAEMNKVAERLAKAQQFLVTAEQALKKNPGEDAQETVKKAQAAKDKLLGEKKVDELVHGDLYKKSAAAEKDIHDFLNQTGPAKSLRVIADDLLRDKVQDLDLLPRFWKENVWAPTYYRGILNNLNLMGILANGTKSPLVFKLLQPGGTAYEKMLIQRANAALLTEGILPKILKAEIVNNFVDQRLATPRFWRDVYHYDDKGNYGGWTRYGAEKTLEFNADGLLILAKDDRGRCSKAATVRYVRDPRITPGINENPLRMMVLDRNVTYEYSGPDDRQGKRVDHEK